MNGQQLAAWWIAIGEDRHVETIDLLIGSTAALRKLLKQIIRDIGSDCMAMKKKEGPKSDRWQL
jgi:hypothetical protein